MDNSEAISLHEFIQIIFQNLVSISQKTHCISFGFEVVNSGDYEERCLLGCDAVCSGIILMAFVLNETDSMASRHRGEYT
jgi:hypothetical protein